MYWQYGIVTPLSFAPHTPLLFCSQDKVTKSDAYACKSLVSSAHLAVTQFYQKNGKPLEEVTLELSKLTEFEEEFERYYARCAATITEP
jgi:hypothetical protein